MPAVSCQRKLITPPDAVVLLMIISGLNMSISAYCIPLLSPVAADFSSVAALEGLLKADHGDDDGLNAKRAAAGVWVVSDLSFLVVPAVLIVSLLLFS